MPVIHNPVLRGFNPDPSILRVGHDYYLATSTFEYHPAVRLHRSRDLAQWSTIGHALDDGFDLRGIPDSGGVWAPSLTHADGKFWLAYSIVRSMDGDDKDIDNYLVTAEAITGPWSEPVHLGSRGFDFSFFHDPDGTHWIVGVQWDQRPEFPSFSGLVVEQYLPAERRTSGEAVRIYGESGLVEGPNLYRIGDWYYLLIAAGGTGWNHGITMARSRSLLGPYERDPREAVLTTRDAPGHPLQKAGHGELVQTPGGDWVLAHLASRPTLHLGERYSTLGRETCLQHVVFDDDGWLRLADGGHHASVEVAAPGVAEGTDAAPGPRGWTDDFDTHALDSRRWSALRAALPGAVADLGARPGWLRLRGGHSAASVFDQSLILTRVEEHRASLEVLLDAAPRTPRETAGPIAWYDRSGWIQLQLTYDDDNGRHLRVVRRDGATTTRSAPVSVPSGPLRLRLSLDGPELRCAWAEPDSEEWMPVPGVHPAWTLSDDHGPRLRFTGLFFGVRADDLDGRGWTADLDRVAVRFEPDPAR
ncbi:glycoside hydrolase 43 family protein [Microbacterium sp. B35-04]|uniref:family 43 glycosylhydrolase n=1 Tax=Microbacterium sp. B35-04 TaxID=1961716 RepID=UPI001EF9A602|nr:family 43 glycosylhydrolase [Microbacterium sp. B35-04]KAF2413908.1 glycoside hydrolase 43 family protein [Microbacterium sp. B35-04]